jgi:hypothetical protein
MRRYFYASILVVAAFPAYADSDNSITLVIENDAGMVSTLPDMTTKECDAAKLLLSARKTYPIVSGVFSSGSFTTMTPVSPPPVAHTSVITSVKCMTTADKKQ